MSRLSILALVSGALLGTMGCRADDAECRALADHVASLASAEGKSTSGTAAALELDCKRLRPTDALLECMMDAQSLAELDAC